MALGEEGYPRGSQSGCHHPCRRPLLSSRSLIPCRQCIAANGHQWGMLLTHCQEHEDSELSIWPLEIRLLTVQVRPEHLQRAAARKWLLAREPLPASPHSVPSVFSSESAKSGDCGQRSIASESSLEMKNCFSAEALASWECLSPKCSYKPATNWPIFFPLPTILCKEFSIQ